MAFLYKILLFSLFFLSTPLWGQESVEKTLKYSYPLTSAGELSITNKYGNIEVYGWEKDSVQVDIHMKVRSKKQGDATDLINRIVPQEIATNDYYELTTEILVKNKNFFNNFYKKISPIDPDKSGVDIDYTIYVPLKATVNLTNKFGNIRLNEFSGNLTVFLEHGDLRLDKPLNGVDLTVKFGEFRSREFIEGKITLKNGGLHLKKCGDIRLTSEGSDISIDSMQNLILKSNQDDIQILSAVSIQGETRYSDIILEQLSGDINLNMHIGNLEIENLIKPAPDVTINQYSANVDLGIAATSWEMKARLESGLMQLPETVENLQNDLIDAKKEIRNVEASYGNAPMGSFNFSGKKGFIILRD